MKMKQRFELIAAGSKINRGYSKFVAFRKLFVSEKRDWKQPSAPRIGWKRGELVEVLQAIGTDACSEEWGDVGYYLAQSYDWLWCLYAMVTPESVIDATVHKYKKRVAKNASRKG